MIIIIPLFITVCVVAWVLRPRREATKSHKVAILATAIPPLILAIASIVFQLLHNAAGNIWVSDISNFLVVVVLGLICAAILALAVFAIVRKSEIAKGIAFGICIGVVIAITEWIALEWLGNE